MPDRPLWVLASAPLVTIILPILILFSVSALSIGGTGIRRVVLVACAILSTAILWLLVASKYILGEIPGKKVGKVFGPLLGWFKNDFLPLSARKFVPSAMDIEFSVLVAPFLFTVLLGSYALITIGIKLLRFNDCEEAAKELSVVRAPLSFPEP